MIKGWVMARQRGRALRATRNRIRLRGDSADSAGAHPHGRGGRVATDSKGNVYVCTRPGGSFAGLGTTRTFTHGGSRLFELDRAGKFVLEIGQGVYGFLFAQAVRIDPQDNIWVVDRGSNMVIKFGRDGRILMTLSRKPEAVGEGAGRGGMAR